MVVLLGYVCRDVAVLQYLLHAVLGNKSLYMDVLFHNIPGTCSIENIQIYSEHIISSYQPLILFVGEVLASKLQQVLLDGYHLVQGNASNTEHVKICAFVKNGCEYQVSPVNSEIQTLRLKLGSTTVTGVYREWLSSDPASKVLQKKRWTTFVNLWRMWRGNHLVMGDMNWDWLNAPTQHQASLEPIRNQVLEKIIPSGGSQLLSTPTRHQRGQTPALLDHIYQRGDLEVPRRFNRNLIGTDHNLVGARVSLKKPVFQPQFIKTWNENCFTTGRGRRSGSGGMCSQILGLRN